MLPCNNGTAPCRASSVRPRLYAFAATRQADTGRPWITCGTVKLAQTGHPYCESLLVT